MARAVAASSMAVAGSVRSVSFGLFRTFGSLLIVVVGRSLPDFVRPVLEGQNPDHPALRADSEEERVARSKKRKVESVRYADEEASGAARKPKSILRSSSRARGRSKSPVRAKSSVSKAKGRKNPGQAKGKGVGALLDPVHDKRFYRSPLDHEAAKADPPDFEALRSFFRASLGTVQRALQDRSLLEALLVESGELDTPAPSSEEEQEVSDGGEFAFEDDEWA